MKGKKQREVAFFKEAISIEPTFFPGHILDENGERPDILMETANGIVGIEITDYWRGRTQNRGGSKIRRLEAAQEDLTNKAQELFEAKHSEPIFVTFHWKSNSIPKKSEIRELANALVKVVSQNIPSEVYSKITVGYHELQETSLDFYLYNIRVQRLKEGVTGGWGVISASFTSVAIEEIQKIIDEKNTKVEEYLSRCDHVVLLIIAESSLRLSGHASLSKEMLTHRYQSEFEQVFFFDRATKKVHLLHRHDDANANVS